MDHQVAGLGAQPETCVQPQNPQDARRESNPTNCPLNST